MGQAYPLADAPGNGWEVGVENGLDFLIGEEGPDPFHPSALMQSCKHMTRQGSTLLFQPGGVNPRRALASGAVIPIHLLLGESADGVAHRGPIPSAS